MNADEPIEEDTKDPYFLVKGEKGGKNMYSFNRKILELEKVLPGELTYPENFGIVLNTHRDNGRPLDGFLLIRDSCPPGSIAKIRPIGALKIKRGGRSDKKIICAASKERSLDDIEDVEELSDKRLKGLSDFFETYGYLNDEEIKVEGWVGRERAEKLLKHTRKLYKRKNE